MTLRYFLTIITALALFACNAQTSDKIKTISATDYSENINNNKNPQIIDVRTPNEYSTGHIKNAKNIDWLGDDFEEQTKVLDVKKPVYVYCKSGNRSSKAAKKLEELGFTQIYELRGGILEWSSTYPTTNVSTTVIENGDKE